MNTITFPNGKKITFENEISPEIFLHNFDEPIEEICALRVNNDIYSLYQKIDIDAHVEPVLLKSSDGSAIYRRSLCFVLATAAHKIYPGKRLLVGHSLGHGYYYTIDGEENPSQEEINKLKNEVQKLIDENLIIRQKNISYEQATKLFEELNLVETRKQLNFHCPPKLMVNTLEGFSDLYFGPLVLSTGVLKIFDIMKYQEGFLLRFPSTCDPDNLSEFEDIPKLFNIYKEYKDWGKRLNVTSAASLNEIVSKRKTKEFIDITETIQQRHIGNIAEQISKNKDVRMVLMAGPSSSGKTTSSKKLALQLQCLGYTPKVVELDTYYLERTKTPKDENGEYDYECIQALDIEQLNKDLINMFEGKEVDLPSYDFKEGKRHYNGKKIKLEKNDILVMEGIHGLNDELTPLIPREQKFKIYLSALTQLNLDDHNRIPTSDNRLIRRIVRDSQFRGKSAADTIKMWPSVQRGERKWIFPFQDKADAMLNTALDYELPVLKVYAAPLLKCVSPLEREYAEATRLLRFLGNFSQIPVTNVPGQSIIREFVGGSEFHY
ncbi:MAG: nucleoside kinase [Treponemataceae bacterium]|nr:nucleoside kinase [Treponemataceae bacterium]